MPQRSVALDTPWLKTEEKGHRIGWRWACKPTGGNNFKQNKERGWKSNCSPLRSGEFTRLCIFPGCHTLGSKFWCSRSFWVSARIMLNAAVYQNSSAYLIWREPSVRALRCVCVVFLSLFCPCWLFLKALNCIMPLATRILCVFSFDSDCVCVCVCVYSCVYRKIHISALVPAGLSKS